jgi:4-amino-4-deoxychorismate lyase
MYPLFESVGILNGQVQNGHYHELRFNKSYTEHYGNEPDYLLFEGIKLPKLDGSLKYKLRICYNKTNTSWTISEYLNSVPNSLKVVHDDNASYPMKYADRNHLNRLYEKRGESDDVLIIKNGHITDATYSNILFTDGIQIVTPLTPLLKGTCRAKLIIENKILETPITLDSIHQFHNFQLVNALNDFDKTRWIDIQQITT